MRILLVAAALAAVSLAGCGKKEESAKPSVTATGEGYTARSKDGTVSVVTGDAAGKAKVPDFAPLYPGARIDSAMDGIGNDQAHGGTLVYKVDASPEKVVDFYKEKASAGGFKTEMDSNMGAAHMFAAKDEASGRALQVIASGAGGGASVQVIWAAKGR
ncbi:MAG: hypothetical protein V4466_16990 [Pseudomonadota bacterium]